MTDSDVRCFIIGDCEDNALIANPKPEETLPLAG